MALSDTRKAEIATVLVKTMLIQSNVATFGAERQITNVLKNINTSNPHLQITKKEIEDFIVPIVEEIKKEE